MIKLSKSKGFTLVELMIVVAIMAILAAIAIPSYLRFQIKARESEMRINLASIRVCEEAYKAQNDLYLAAIASTVPDPPTVPVAWSTPAGFDAIGFEPDGRVRYSYQVTVAVASAATLYTADATGDVDGDGTDAVWEVNQDSAIPVNTGAGDH